MSEEIVTPEDEQPKGGNWNDDAHELNDLTEEEIAKGNEWGAEDEPDFAIVDGEKVYID